MKTSTKFLILLNVILPLICYGQNKDFENAVKNQNKIDGLYVAPISKPLTQEKFVTWAEKNPDYKILGAKTKDLFVFGVLKACITEVKFLLNNEDALILLAPGKLYRMSKEGIEYTYQAYEESKNNLFKVKLNDKWGVVSKTGKLLIPIEYDVLYFYENNLFKVEKNKKFAFLNNSGSLVTPMYDYMGSFEWGLSKVSINGKYGYIDKFGKEIVPVQYTNAGDFSNGLAAVSQNGKWGYINTIGQIIVPLKYDIADKFKNGLGLVGVNGNKGCLDSNGSIVLQLNYSNLSSCEQNDIAQVLIEEGTYDGVATYTYSWGTYSGNYVDGKPDGYGKANYPNSEFYEGQYKNGRYHGKGTYRQANGVRVTGNFVNGSREGSFTAQKWTLMGLATDKWDLEFKNDVLISNYKTESGLTDFYKDLNDSSSKYEDEKRKKVEDEKKLAETKKIKEKITNVKDKLELVEIIKSAFWDECPCEKYREKANFFGLRDDWYIFKDKNGKWYYHGSLNFFDSKPYKTLDELIFENF